MTRDSSLLGQPPPLGLAEAGGLPLDGKTSLGLWPLYLLVWSILAVVSLVLVRMGVDWTVPVLFMAPLTLVGVTWRPLFGLALMCALMPIAHGIAIKSVFSAEQGMGIVFGLGAFTNILLTRKRLRLVNTMTLALFGISALSLLSLMWALYPELAIQYVRTPAQMFVYIVLVVSVVRQERDLRWPLRVFVVACLVGLIGSKLIGTPAEQTRFTIAVVGTEEDNPNLAGALFGLGFLTAVYLFRRDPGRIQRWIYLAAMAALPVGVLMTGGRKATFFLLVPLILPMFSMRLTSRQLRVAAGATAGLVAMVVVGLLAARYLLPIQTVQRYTDPLLAARGYAARLFFIQESLEFVAKHPLGAGLACFRSSNGRIVHNDLFYLFSNLGFAGAIVFGAFAVSLGVAIWRMARGMDKWYAASVYAYQMLLGLGGTWIFAKHYWLFMAVAWLLWAFQAQQRAAAAAEPLLPAANGAATGAAPPSPPGHPAGGR